MTDCYSIKRWKGGEDTGMRGQMGLGDCDKLREGELTNSEGWRKRWTVHPTMENFLVGGHSALRQWKSPSLGKKMIF